MLFGHLHVFFGKMSIQVLLIGLLVFLLFSCLNYLYTLDLNLLLVISFANIFSHSVGCLFILSIVFFAMEKLLSLIRSHLYIFAFISFALGDRSKKKYCSDLYQTVLPMLSARSFMISGLTFGA